MKRKIAILTSGKSRGSNFCAVVDYIRKNDLPVEIAFIVVTNRKAPVINKTQHYGIDLLFLPTKDMAVFEDKLIYHCREKDVELIALAGFLKKLSASFITSFGKPILNIHPALLPQYGGKGMYGDRVHQEVFASGDKVSGVTIHYVDEGYDTGNIIVQQEINIENCRSPQEIARKVLEVEHRLYAPTIYKVLTQSR